MKKIKKVNMEYTPHIETIEKITNLSHWINKEVHDNLNNFICKDGTIKIIDIILKFEKKLKAEMNHCWYTMEDLYNIYDRLDAFSVFENEYGVPTIKYSNETSDIDTLVIHTHVQVYEPDLAINDNNLVIPFYQSTIGNNICRNVINENQFYSTYKTIKIDISELLIIEKLIHGEHVPIQIDYNNWV